MAEKYLSDSAYKTHFEELNGLRYRIAKKLPVKPGMKILDLASGDGGFAVEVAKRFSDLEVIGIDIDPVMVKSANRNIRKHRLQARVRIVNTDAARTDFKKDEFDIIVNFTGLDEIFMTGGVSGIQNTFFEMNRILKMGNFFCLAIMPTGEMETNAQKLEIDLFKYMCNAVYLSNKKYDQMLKKANFKLIKKLNYYSGIKFTPEQAEKEIKYTLNDNRNSCGIKRPTFKQVWDKFGDKIEKFGVGCYSKITLLITKKINGI